MLVTITNSNLKKTPYLMSGIFCLFTSLLLFLWVNVCVCEGEKGEPETYQDGAGDTGVTICRRLSGHIWWLFLQQKTLDEYFFLRHRIWKHICKCVITYLTTHGLGPVTGDNLEGDATPHLPLCGKGDKMHVTCELLMETMPNYWHFRHSKMSQPIKIILLINTVTILVHIATTFGTNVNVTC